MIFVFLSYYAVKKMIARREQERFALDAPVPAPAPASLAPSRRTTWSRPGAPVSRGARALSRLFPFGTRSANDGSGRSAVDLELGLREAGRRGASSRSSIARARPAQAIAQLVVLNAPDGAADGRPGAALLRAVTGETRARSDSEGTASSGGGRGRGRGAAAGRRGASPTSAIMVCEEEDPVGEVEVGRVEDEARRERRGGEDGPGLASACAVGGMLSVPSVNRQLFTSSNT
jgi:hypothetical protein